MSKEISCCMVGLLSWLAYLTRISSDYDGFYVEKTSDFLSSDVAHLQCLIQVMLLQPSLITNPKNKLSLTLQLSRGLRTLLAWFRCFKKNGEMREKMLRKASPRDREILEWVAAEIVLENPEETKPNEEDWLDLDDDMDG